MIENVLLITVDSLRADATPHGPRPEKNPGHTHQNEVADSIRAIAREGIEYSKAFATGPGTTPSFPGILTGTHPLSHGGLGPLTDERPRLSNQMRAADRTTAGFQCNPFLSTHFNYDVGFDRFEDYQNPLMGIATKIFPRGIEINHPKLRQIDERLHLTDAIKKGYQLAKGKPRPYVSADVITDDTIDFLSDVDDQFFCWAHYMDVHHPCFPPEFYRERHNAGDITQAEIANYYSTALDDPTELDERATRALHRLYAAAIEYVDDQISRILEELRRRGLYEDTLVIVTSDHGELFGEYGQYGKPERMYDELLHVPLIVANGSDYLEDATDDLVSLLDVPPLIHDAFGLDIPDDYEGLRPGVDDSREFIMAEHEVEGEVIVGARSENWLYEGDEIRDEHRLFDLRNGNFERVDIAGYDEESESIRAAVNNRLDQLDVKTRRLEDEVEGDVQSRLEDLGYL